MGFFNEIKKLLFSVKSVSKSSTDKLVQKGKKTGEEIIDKGSVAVGRVKDNVEEIGEDVIDFTEKLGEKVVEKGTEFVERAKEIAEDVGSKVLGKDSESRTEEPNKGKMTADDLFEADFQEETESFETDDDLLQEKGDFDELVPEQGARPPEPAEELGIIDQARVAVDKLGKDLEDAIHEIQELEKEEIVSRPLSESMKKGSLEDKDDFFKKAEAFAEGKYDNRPRVSKESEKPAILGKEKEEGKKDDLVPGFEDLDGDGDEIIDDAFIVSEEE